MNRYDKEERIIQTFQDLKKMEDKNISIKF